MNTKKSNGRLQLRKKPQQERSIQRLDAILEAAAALVAEEGVGKLKMTDIAARAGVPIGSLYQFFPERAAIIRALHDRHTIKVQRETEKAFPNISTIAQALDRMDDLFRQFYQIYRADKTYLPVWMSGMTDLDLQQLNAQHLRKMTEIVFDALKHLVAEENWEQFKLRVHMQLYLSGAIVRFAMVSDDETAQRYMAEWRTMVVRTFFEF